jgi:hypothetical protein
MDLLKEILQDTEQGSEMWNKIRLGKFTSSEIHRLVSHKGKLTEKAEGYVFEKAAEIITGESKSFDNAATVWGHQHEAEAAEAFEKKTELSVTTCGFELKTENYGGSPDRLVGFDGLLEIKCPFNSANHIKHCLLENQEEFKKECSEYYWQIQSNLNVTERQFAFFVSYDPRNATAPLYVLLIKRDEKDIELINKSVEMGVVRLKEVLSRLAA